MNKYTEVLEAEYDIATGSFLRISYILKSFYIKNGINDTQFRINLSDWFKGRGISSWRDKLDLLLYRLNIIAPSEFLDKAFWVFTI